MTAGPSSPIYYSTSFYPNEQDKLDKSPDLIVEDINHEILEYRPKAKLIKLISIIAFTALAILIAAVLMALGLVPPLVGCIPLLITPILIYATVLDGIGHRKYLTTAAKIEEEIRKFPPKTFTYKDKYPKTIEIAEQDDFDLIKEFLDPDFTKDKGIQLLVERQIRYEWSGGEPSSGTISPLQLQLMATVTNANEKLVVENYTPWINQLLVVAKATIPAKEKQELCRSIGFMIHPPIEAVALGRARSCEHYYYEFDKTTQTHRIVHQDQKLVYCSTAQEVAQLLEQKYQIQQAAP